MEIVKEHSLSPIQSTGNMYNGNMYNRKVVQPEYCITQPGRNVAISQICPPTLEPALRNRKGVTSIYIYIYIQIDRPCGVSAPLWRASRPNGLRYRTETKRRL